MNPKWIRRPIQILVWIYVLLVPALGIWGVAATTRYANEDMAYRYTELGRSAAAQLDVWLGDPTPEAASALLGSPISFRILGLELNDPLMLPAMLLDGRLPALTALLGAGLVLVLHLLLGRAFCGYACPYGSLSRLVNRIRKPLRAAGLVLDVAPPRWLRWVLLVAVLLAPVLGMGLAPLVLPYVGVSRAAHAAYFGGITGALGGVLALLASDLLLWEHGVCRGICPSGALQGALGRFRMVHLVAVRGVPCARSCHVCAEDCWLGLDPRAGNPGNDCDSCGRCIKGCPPNRLAVIIKPGAVTKPVRLAALVMLLPMLQSCARPVSPRVISDQAPWATPFQPVSEIERKQVRFKEYDRAGRVLGVGIAGGESGPQGLRLYLEEKPGEPWTGPLKVQMRNSSGSVELSFADANSPPSAAERTLYEATIDVSVGTELVMLDGPHAGAAVLIPVQTYDRMHLGWLWGLALVMGAWVLGLAFTRLRR